MSARNQSSGLSARRELLFKLPRKRLRLAFGNAQRPPGRAGKMLRKQNNLVNVPGIMQQLPVDRLQGCVLFTRYVNCLHQLARTQARNGV